MPTPPKPVTAHTRINEMALEAYKHDINALQCILDQCQVSVDYVEFGSTNDYDRFKEIVQRLYYDACMAPWLHKDEKADADFQLTGGLAL